MTTATEEKTRHTLEITIKLVMITFLFSWCFFIIKPFIIPVIWAMIISVSMHPIYDRLVTLFKGRNILCAVLVTVFLLLIIATPIILFGSIIIENAGDLENKLVKGTFTIPLPTENVATWPVVGKVIFDYWTLASTNLLELIKEAAPQLKVVAHWLLTSSFTMSLDILGFILAIIVSGVFLANSENVHRFTLVLAERVAGGKGKALSNLTKATIRSVSTGVLGVALIQSLFAGAGLVVADIPWAGLLTTLCFFLAVIQIGPGIILILSVIYVFSNHSSVFAVIYMIWCIFVMLMDNVLKPILLGRGNAIPTVIIFMGAIGGLMFSGIIGLFVGAVVLALGYELFKAWLFEHHEESL
jgi:predicted PurR-regulated permease PerM